MDLSFTAEELAFQAEVRDTSILKIKGSQVGQELRDLGTRAKST